MRKVGRGGRDGREEGGGREGWREERGGRDRGDRQLAS